MYRKLSVSLLLLIGGWSFLLSQERTNTAQSIQSMLERSQRTPDLSNIPVSSPMDAPINPDTYVVGPGDVFSVETWLGPALSSVIPVSPEGSLIVPTVGELKVSDRTLAEARKIIVDAVSKTYVAQKPTVTLIRVRSVVVFVRGHVAVPGRTILFASDRVEKAIRYADHQYDYDAGRAPTRLPDEAELQLLAREYESTMSHRNIMLRRRNGNVIRVDLVKYHATGDDRWNPTLLEGDEIIVPRSEGVYNTIGVYGGVNLPGRFEFVEGETILDAVTLAQGFNSKALRDTLFLLRRTDSNTALVQSSFAIVTDLSRKEAAKVLLQPGDRVYVKERRELRGDYAVTIEGEVRKPGKYPITRENTKLSQAITMAEGFTPNALLSAAQLQRPVTEGILERQVSSIKNLGNLNSLEDTTYFRTEQQLRAERELVAVNFDRLFTKGDSLNDVVLRDGDRIFVPSRQRTVYVYGQVLSPGHVPFLPGSPASYYISKAGGYSDDALTGEIKVIKAASKQWLDPNETSIEEGDAVWVPKDVRRPFYYYLSTASQATSIITAALTIVILFIQLNK